MFVLFHYIPYEGEALLGVYSTLELAQAAGQAKVAAMDADEFDSFYGRLEAYPCELDAAFEPPYGQPPVWTFVPKPR